MAFVNQGQFRFLVAPFDDKLAHMAANRKASNGIDDWNSALVEIMPRAALLQDKALMLFLDAPIHPDILDADKTLYKSFTEKLHHSKHKQQLITAFSEWEGLSLEAKSSVIQDHLKFVYCILDRKQPILNLNWDKANSFEKELKNSNGDIIRPSAIPSFFTRRECLNERSVLIQIFAKSRNERT